MDETTIANEEQGFELPSFSFILAVFDWIRGVINAIIDAFGGFEKNFKPYEPVEMPTKTVE